MNGSRQVAALLALLALLPAAPRPAAADALDPALRARLASATPDDRIPVLVTLDEGHEPPAPVGLDRGAGRAELIAALRSRNDAAQAPVRTLLERREPGAAILPLWMVDALAVTVRPATVRELAISPGVRSVRLDAPVRLPVRTTAAAVAGPAWNLDLLHAPDLWADGVDGTGVVVATLDTGVDVRHPDLAGRWRGGPGGWFDPWGAYDAPHDTNGHGTQTAGLIVGGSASGSPIGVAPGARWIAAKIYDDAGNSTLSAIHRSLQWALDPDGDPATDDAPDVVSSSWGFEDRAGDCVTEFEEDLAVLRAAGIAVVFAAGNAGPQPSSSVSPANYPGVVSVGAIDATLQPDADSSRGPSACGGGPFPSLVAPGVDVKTADLTGGGAFPKSWTWVSGTSFAAPHVAGAIALLRSASPCSSNAEIEQALEDSATAIEPGPADRSGHGLVDVAAARARLAQTRTCPHVVAEVPADALGVDADGGDASGGGENPVDAPGAGGCTAPGGPGGGPWPLALVLGLLGVGSRRFRPR